MVNRLRKAAKGQACTLRAGTYLGIPCGLPETTVLCHAPSRDSGMSIKSNDLWAAFGCHVCHDLIDDRDERLTQEQKRECWLRGIYETQKIQGVYDGND